MELMSEDWEIMSRKTNRPWFTSFLMIVLGLVMQDNPGVFSNVTWTVRQKSTGMTKRVTANSESAAANKIANGWFDAD
jgi:hypothetical protein